MLLTSIFDSLCGRVKSYETAKRTNPLEKEDRENYSSAALTANPRVTRDIYKLFQSTWKITERQVAAPVDLSRTNPVKCKRSRLERSGHCSARAAAGAEAAEGAGAAQNG